MGVRTRVWSEEVASLPPKRPKQVFDALCNRSCNCNALQKAFFSFKKKFKISCLFLTRKMPLLFISFCGNHTDLSPWTIARIGGRCACVLIISFVSRFWYLCKPERSFGTDRKSWTKFGGVASVWWTFFAG